jgi:outer membrane protein W
MSKKILILPLLLLLVGAADLMAQNWEVQPFIGYRFSNSVSVDDVTHESLIFDQIKIADGMAYGVSVGYFLTPKVSAEFAWSSQSSDLRATTIGGVEYGAGDMTVHNFHGNILYHFGDPDSAFRPYILGGLGATVYSPDAPNAEGKTKFSTNWGGGVKINAGKHLGIRLQGRWIPTYVGSEDYIVYDPYWGYWVMSEAKYQHQFEVTAGLNLRF